jgi:hypothetical protein
LDNARSFALDVVAPRDAPPSRLDVSARACARGGRVALGVGSPSELDASEYPPPCAPNGLRVAPAPRLLASPRAPPSAPPARVGVVILARMRSTVCFPLVRNPAPSRASSSASAHIHDDRTTTSSTSRMSTGAIDRRAIAPVRSRTRRSAVGIGSRVASAPRGASTRLAVDRARRSGAMAPYVPTGRKRGRPRDPNKQRPRKPGPPPAALRVRARRRRRRRRGATRRRR